MWAIAAPPSACGECALHPRPKQPPPRTIPSSPLRPGLLLTCRRIRPNNLPDPVLHERHRFILQLSPTHSPILIGHELAQQILGNERSAKVIDKLLRRRANLRVRPV